MIADKLNLLPDGMEPAEILKYFDELLAEIDARDNLDVLDVSEALYQLADRQWHTFTVLPDRYKKSIENWFVTHWRRNCLQFTVNAGFIASSLGLIRVLDCLESNIHDPRTGEDVRRESIEIVKELRPKIHDPYQGLRAT